MKGIDPHSRVDGFANYVIILKLNNKAKSGKNYLMAMFS